MDINDAKKKTRKIILIVTNAFLISIAMNMMTKITDTISAARLAIDGNEKQKFLFCNQNNNDEPKKTKANAKATNDK